MTQSHTLKGEGFRGWPLNPDEFIRPFAGLVFHPGGAAGFVTGDANMPQAVLVSMGPAAGKAPDLTVATYDKNVLLLQTETGS